MPKRHHKRKAKTAMSRPHVNVGTIGHVDHGQSTVASAVNIALAIRYAQPYAMPDDIATSHIEFK